MHLNPDIFTKISDNREKAQLFTSLAAARGEVQAKKPEPSADLVSLKAYDFSEPDLRCQILGTTSELFTAGALVMTFFIGGEKYFFQAEYSKKADTIIIKTNQPVYHLQRREDYRIRIPSSYKALLEVISHNSQPFKKSVPLLDLSAGGCRIQTNKSKWTLKTGDEVRGHIFLPDRAPIEVTGIIRHARPMPNEKDFIACGVQFVGLQEPLKNKIAAVVMDLYRELFSRLS